MKVKGPQPPKPDEIVEITPETLAATIQSFENNTICEAERRIALAVLKSFSAILAFLSTTGMTIARLRRYLGVEVGRPQDDAGTDPGPGNSSGRSDPPSVPDSGNGGGRSANHPSEGGGGKGGNGSNGRDRHGRSGKDDFPDGEQRYFAHPDFDKAGCTCPDCLEPRMSLVGTGGGLRFHGQPWLKVSGLNREIWRCGHCGAQCLAPLPAEIEIDGGARRVGYSAASMVALAKYLYGTPWNRQERFSSLLDFHLPAQTQWEFCLQLGEVSRPIYNHLPHLAALAGLYLSDDTGARVVGLKAEERVERNSGRTVMRTGVHTSCVVSMLSDGRKIILYKTGIIHAGEFLDEILVHRPAGLPRPGHMSDGLAANAPTVANVEEGDCNAHARRKLEEKQGQWPAVWEYVKGVYKSVYKNEADAKAANMTPEQRLELHRTKSLPIMKAMFVWMFTLLASKEVSPNSGLGGIFEYFLSRERGLTAFCRIAGFPIDNNFCEQLQKIVAQHRKNAEYFRTLRGAGIADIIMSLGVTAMYAGVNAFDYFNTIQRFKDEVARSPADFLPWNYADTVKQLMEASPPVKRFLEVSEAQYKERQVKLRSDAFWGGKSSGADASNRRRATKA